MSDIKDTVNDTKNSRRENGGHAYIGDDKITRWDEGPDARQIQVGNKIITKATMTPFKVNGKVVKPNDASNPLLWFHVHPDVTINGISLGDSSPSQADKNYQGSMEDINYSFNSFVIGAGTNTVTYFNSKGSIITVNYAQWETIRL